MRRRPRSLQVAIPGARVQVANTVADLVNVSRAGAHAEGERCCRDAGRGKGGRDLHRVHVSFERRCPRCRSDRVTKERRYHYACMACNYRFVGFKLGPFRLAV